MKLWTKPTRGSAFSRSRKGTAGFTFAEVLAALVFMAIVIPVAIEGLRIANRAGTVAQRKTEAARLGNNLLNELIVTDQWQGVQLNGTFEPERPGYRWRLFTENWGRDSLRLLTMEVFYEVQNQEYSVLLSTVVPPPS